MKKKKGSSLMQKMRSIVESKGFYIALASLIVLVGFSIYARRIQIKNQSNSLSFDDEAWQAALEESGVEFKGSYPAEEKQPDETENATDSNSEPVPEPKPTISVPESLPPAVETAVPVLPQSGPEHMQMPCLGEIIQDCSIDNLVYCATMDDWRTHNGLDIAAAEGEPVIAAAAGTVSKVYEDDMLGIVVTLDHGDGITSLYGNLQSKDFISVGTPVLAGDIIGGVGTPGALESDKEPHLHFEVYKNDELQNPNDFIKP